MSLNYRRWMYLVSALVGLALVFPLGAGEPAAKEKKNSVEENGPASPPNSSSPKESGSAALKKDTGAKKNTKDVDYELYKVLVDALDQVDQNYVVDVNRRELIEAAIRGALSKLDPYSNYMGPDEVRQFRTSLAGEFGGIGIQIAVDDGQLRVLSPMYDTPAYRAGILAGDRILEINGKSTEGISIDEAVKRLQGEVGEPLSLTIAHPGKDVSEKIKITREKIHLETVMGDRRGSDGSWDYMLDPKQRIGYVRLTGFSSDTAAKLKKVLENLQAEKIRGLILDLRFNPGGLLNAAIEVSDFFIPDGRIVSTKGRNSPERTWDAHKEGTFSGFSMVVLVNRYSASASEIVAACLQDHGRAVVIGERTWGKGSVQNVIELEDGKSILKLTTAAYRRPNGKNIHRFPEAKESDEWGVMPNKSYDMELDDDEMVALAEYRRDRDILRLTPKTTNGKDHGDIEKSDAKKTAVKDAASISNGKNGKAKSGDAKKEDKKKSEPSKPFVDRQLQAALKYLNTEIAKAQ